MLVRAIDTNGDWLFGKSSNDYLSNNAAINQNIKTRLLSFLGDCFFDITAGIDWFNLLSDGKNQNALSLNISSTILNTSGVIGLIQLSISLNINRSFFVSYQIQTIYSVTTNNFTFSLEV